MEFTHQDMRKAVKSIFNTKLNKLNDEFTNDRDLVLTREFVESDFKNKKAKEDKREQIKKIPLIGKSIDRIVPRKDFAQSSDRCKFILSLMDKLSLEYIDISKMQEIAENRDKIYEEYFCRDCEYEFSAKIADMIINGLEK